MSSVAGSVQLEAPSLASVKRKRSPMAASRSTLEVSGEGDLIDKRDLEKQALLGESSISNSKDSAKEKTFLYLGFGSNLAKSTFEGMRKVKPLAQVNVHAPSLELTFDLPGFAYAEPCFANSRKRITSHSAYGATDGEKVVVAKDENENDMPIYHVWSIPNGRTTVPDPESYPAPSSPLLPHIPEGAAEGPEPKSFLAQTLLAPLPSAKSSLFRKPNWAQPSPRYIGLLRTGARERGLPAEYIDWLDGLMPFEITTMRQKAGKYIFITFWGPFILSLIQLGKLVTNKEGKAPHWFSVILLSVFSAAWWSYDHVFRRLTGEGERTIGS